jgi:hypothetical protein
MADDQHNVIPVHTEQVQGLTPVGERVVRKRDGQGRSGEHKQRRKKARPAADEEATVLEPEILADEDGHVDFRA